MDQGRKFNQWERVDELNWGLKIQSSPFAEVAQRKTLASDWSQ
jgi:hypothetical protein